MIDMNVTEAGIEAEAQTETDTATQVQIGTDTNKEAGAETEETWADRATETEIEPVAESRQNKTRHNKQTGRLSL